MTQATEVVEINCETNEVTRRPLTAKEIEQNEIAKIQMAEREAQMKVEAEALADLKASALAKLAILGLTEDEAKAIIG
jgi:hypothetical protein